MPVKTANQPSWSSTSKRERRAMKDWVHLRLEEKIFEIVGSQDNVEETRLALAIDKPETYAAEHGDIQPLRKKYPHLAPYLHLAPLKRGVTRNALRQGGKHKRSERVAAVASLVRDIWKEHYNRRNRKADDGYSAEEIAEDYLRLCEH